MCYESYDTIFILYATTSCCPSDFLVCCLPVQTLASKRRGRPGPEFGVTDPADTFVAEPATFDELMVLSIMQYTWRSTYLPLTLGLGTCALQTVSNGQHARLEDPCLVVATVRCTLSDLNAVYFFNLDFCGDSVAGGHLVYLQDLCPRPSCT